MATAGLVAVVVGCSGPDRRDERAGGSPRSTIPAVPSTTSSVSHHKFHRYAEPNVYRGHHYVRGVETVAAAADAPIACVDRDLGRVKPGKLIDVTVRQGAESLTLHGVSRGRWYAPEHVMLYGGRVVLRLPGHRTIRYRIPLWTRPSGPRVAMVIGSRSVHGYLCLVRFEPGQPAVGVVGVKPRFMGAAPVLAFLAPGASHRQIVYGGFRSWSIDVSGWRPVVKTDDSRFFSVGGSDADSGAPLDYFTVEDGRLRNISSEYQTEIAAHAERWWRQFEHPHHGPYFGAIATWAADECTLGRQRYAFDTLDRLQAAGRFRPFTALRHHHFTHVSYARHLERFLVRTGYAH